MKFSLPVALLAFGLWTSASPYPEASPKTLGEANSKTVAEASPDFNGPSVNLTIKVPNDTCQDGKYYCATLTGDCVWCAIAVGTAENTCKLNNLCGGSNTCRYATNGQPYCI